MGQRHFTVARTASHGDHGQLRRRFAPAAGDHQRLIQLMEGVEDIPEPCSAPNPWQWESFPDYMECCHRRPFDMDIGAQLHTRHSRLLMGERGARRDPATPEDNRAMAHSLQTRTRGRTRLLDSRTSTTAPRPATTPDAEGGEDELTAIAGAMHKVGRSVLQFVLDQGSIRGPADDAAGSGEYAVPDSFSSRKPTRRPRRWRQTLDSINEASARGLSITAQLPRARRAVAGTRIACTCDGLDIQLQRQFESKHSPTGRAQFAP